MLSRLYTPLLVVIVAVASWAAFGPLSAFICFLVFGLALALAVRGWPGFWIFVICIFLLVGLLMPGLHSAREGSRRGSCMNNLRNLSLAVLAYESAHKCFPPPCITDKNGKPMHSWRTLILPYLERRDTYEQYNFDEPWDSPNNKKLLAMRPRLYACAADEQAYEDGTTTSYVAVVGPSTMWHRDKTGSLDELSRHAPLANTIMLIETGVSGIPWTAPVDFDLQRLAESDGSLSAIRGPHMRSNGYFYRDTPGGINVAFADGHQELLFTSNLNVDELAKLLSIGGWQDGNFLPIAEAEELQFNWPHCIGLPVWVFSVALLFYQSHRIRKKRERVTNSQP